MEQSAGFYWCVGLGDHALMLSGAQASGVLVSGEEDHRGPVSGMILR